MKVTPLPLETRIAEGADLEVLVTHDDLTNTTNAASQTLNLFPIDVKMSVELKRMVLDEPFEDTADAGNNTVPVIVGDSGSTNRLLASTELAKNGTYVSLKNGTGTNYVYTSATTVDAIFGATTTGKNLAALNKGRIRFLFRVNDERAVPPKV